ncbi:MAG: hypothetical protein ACU0CI_07500 [Shimia sp.]
MSNRIVLLLIIAFVALTLGSFIWFVATWDRELEEPVTLLIEERSL